ncbi:MAG: basic amino acid ABC transporter substrate-binding protein [Eubacterium sp.]|jgi:ABC-type amino acid transport substrate-binding protein
MKGASFKKSAKAAAIIISAAMVMTLFACGSSQTDSSTSTSDEKETYTVATEATYPPFESTEEDGTLVGVDIDLMEAIAEDQGFEIEWVNMAFDSLFPALNSGNADIVAAAVSSNPERAENADFSDGYYESGSCIMVTEDSDYNSIDDLDSNAKIACQIGTTIQENVQALVDEGKGGEVVALDTFSTSVMQLKNGDVQAVASESIVIDEYMAENPGFKKIGQIPNVSGSDDTLRFAVAKGNTELLDKINQGLADIVESGKYQEIMDKYSLTGMYD